jgi:hypothetical protein
MPAACRFPYSSLLILSPYPLVHRETKLHSGVPIPHPPYPTPLSTFLFSSMTAGYDGRMQGFGVDGATGR